MRWTVRDGTRMTAAWRLSRRWLTLLFVAGLLSSGTVPAVAQGPPPGAPLPNVAGPTPPTTREIIQSLQREAARGIPDGFAPWWQPALAKPLGPSGQGLEVAPDGLVLAALEHSAQVRVFRDTVVVRQWSITEAQGRFDARAFAESKYINTSDPVGSTLTTGGPDRWLDSNWYASAGIRRKTTTGADIQVSQKIGYEDSNSLYFVPPFQGSSRLGVTLTQPLLNGAGKAYNCSVVVLADINTDIARERFSKDLQSLLLDVYKAYWELYLQRAALIQRTRLYGEAVAIRNQLYARREVDVLRGQLLRAEAAVANREAALIRYQGAVHNTEARICAMVNDPGLSTPATVEMIPQQLPIRGRMPANLNDNLVTALHFRPEIQQGIKEIRAASVRADVAANEVLPVLSAVIETYVAGLQGHGEVPRAFGDQFSEGRPSYTGGLLFEMPLGGNRAACSRLQQRRIEVRQATSQLEATTANIHAEVEIAVRDIDTAYREMVSKYHAIIAGGAEIQYLTARWQALPGDQQSAGFVLDELLNAQERLALAEYDFAAAEAGYNVALVNLGRVTGTLVKAEEIGQLLSRQDRPAEQREENSHPASPAAVPAPTAADPPSVSEPAPMPPSVPLPPRPGN
jgi:outer membrane protein TolC